MLIRDAIQSWRGPVVPDDDELWQVRRGLVFLAVRADPAEPEMNDGLFLKEGDALRLSAGRRVWYRRAGRDDAVIARELG